VHYECEACKGCIDEHLKTELLAAGRWIVTNPGPDRAAGFAINALYSPLGWFSWRQVLLKWLAAQRDPSGTKLKTFYNTILGEAYDEAGESLDPHFLKARVESWRLGGIVPAKCLLLTAGADIQHNRIEVYVWGWGRDLESWLIDRHVIFGSPALDTTWQALEDLLAKGYQHAGGNSVRIAAMAVDSSDGVTTHFVRVFARKWSHTRRVVAVKGQAVAGKAVIGRPSKQDVNYRGDIIKGGVEIWQYGADTAKGALYARLKIEPPKVGESIDWMAVQAGGIPGYVHLPGGLPDEVFDQLTAEKRVTRYLRGQPRVEWVLEKGRRNEALDCAGMADAAAEYAGRSRANWDLLERVINPGQKDLLVEAARAHVEGSGKSGVAIPPVGLEAESCPGAPAPARVDELTPTPAQVLAALSRPRVRRVRGGGNH
jgi:phage terminase large subunit GpA-like protein